jgi:quercetin dioxygenase-like cupin family protein
MKLYNWESVGEEQLNDKLTRRVIFGDKVMIARIFLKKGCMVPTHHHESEQMTTVYSGSLKFVIDGREVIVNAGETLHIPSFVPHSAEALEDTDETDVFSPIRLDWLDGSDHYLRQ